MTEHMLSLEWEFADDGLIHLEQNGGCGEMERVWLHPAQLRVLCERAGLVKTTPVNLADHLTEAHLRRLRGLTERIEELHNNEHFFNDIFDRCGDGPAWWLHIRAIFDMSQDLLSDLGEPIAKGVRPDKSVEPGTTVQTALDLEGEIDDGK